ncbi:uncharacterized protein BP01DRAFT_363006 [Aspergillus saccharolyticus JOP 1030-1]|uniref:Uncharacterized protein n=1 Tax=Aspergillus saccharolyticus JOP 1030-1 TaxID=1450539 RepID=A0A319AA70_9EURO|nr:hypothetical protein BP01DRAFT_363006 [Aspergillus saccharolyticus JOP 1030-1]PYH48528.1 hypothetical protein BP01DRAFT_363006 [Aspergillus saccharolyticus JOP 1030-1]
MTHDVDDRQSNWQAVTDMFIAKYSHLMRVLASGHHHWFGLLSPDADVTRIWDTFVDYDERSVDAEMERCATQFILLNAADDSQAHRAVDTVSSQVCTSFVKVMKADECGRSVTVAMMMSSARSRSGARGGGTTLTTHIVTS